MMALLVWDIIKSNKNGELMTGICISKPEIDSIGKIKLFESWEWTSGDKSKGTSILKEI